jgi:hypothetical protein
LFLFNHPKPSTADYTPQNVAPLIQFFVSIVSGVSGTQVGNCDIEFRYENNTPDDPKDDISVRHPQCVSAPYTPQPSPVVKSPEMLKYEAFAKKSQRLKNYAANLPIKIQYFE